MSQCFVNIQFGAAALVGVQPLGCSSHAKACTPTTRPTHTFHLDKVLGKNPFDDMRLFDPGQALVQALEREGQFLVVDAQLVQDGCVQVAHGHGVLHDVVAEIVVPRGLARCCS